MYTCHLYYGTCSPFITDRQALHHGELSPKCHVCVAYITVSYSPVLYVFVILFTITTIVNIILNTSIILNTRHTAKMMMICYYYQ